MSQAIGLAIGVAERACFRAAVPEDAAACIALRGRTRENVVSPERLQALGITVDSWAADIRSGASPGEVCHLDGELVGYCFGARSDGEILVLALLPQAEGQGIGRHLLHTVMRRLAALGHGRLHLGCSPDPGCRSHGFYRRLGWRSTGGFDAHGDEVLEHPGLGPNEPVGARSTGPSPTPLSA